MNIALDRRAEIAYRSLTSSEQMRINRVLERIKRVQSGQWWRGSQVRKLDVGDEGDIFSIRADDRLRIIAKPDIDTVLVQDIVPVERLARVSGPDPR